MNLSASQQCVIFGFKTYFLLFFSFFLCRGIFWEIWRIQIQLRPQISILPKYGAFYLKNTVRVPNPSLLVQLSWRVASPLSGEGDRSVSDFNLPLKQSDEEWGVGRQWLLQWETIHSICGQGQDVRLITQYSTLNTQPIDPAALCFSLVNLH